MPFVSTLPDNRPSTNAAHPENFKLWLPSEVAAPLRRLCVSGVAEKEWQLRRGQLGDTLAQIRRSLCVHTHLTKYKKKNVRGQRPNTRHNALIDTNSRRTRRHANAYNHARKAMLALDPGRDNWQQDFLPLLDSDIVPLYVAIYSDDDPKTSRKSQKDRRTNMTNVAEGHRTVPWIWRASGILSDDNTDISTENLNDGMYPV